jgi:RNA polymerase sigma-70 factor (ECF subfamily)
MTPAISQKHRANSSTILQRIVINDRTAVADCIDTYGNLIWAMARKLTDSSSEAENAVLEIFIDIWRDAELFESNDWDERDFIVKIALRRLLKLSKFKQKIQQY